MRKGRAGGPGFINEAGVHHVGGQERCEACDAAGYPRPCQMVGCDGLIHAHLRHERQGRTIQEGSCDKCGNALPTYR
jgi:hypothetical protein